MNSTSPKQELVLDQNHFEPIEGQGIKLLINTKVNQDKYTVYTGCTDFECIFFSIYGFDIDSYPNMPNQLMVILRVAEVLQYLV